MSVHKWKVFKGRFLGFENYQKILGDISSFWIFIYRWKLFNLFSDFLPSHKSMLKKTWKKKRKNINYIMWKNDMYDKYNR